MDTTEKRILYSYKSTLQEQVDPLKIAHKLYRNKFLNLSQKKSIFSSHHASRNDIWDVLVTFIEKKGCLQQFLRVLFDCGYIELFLQIAVQWQCLLKATSKDVMVVQRTESIDISRRFSQELFVQLKIKTHNIQLGNPRQAIHEQTQMYKLQYLQERHITEKHILADKYASSLCAEIDAHTMLYVRKLPSHGLFEELQQLLPHTSNTHVTQVAYDSRLAIAYAIADKNDQADDYIRKAMASTVYIGHCVELVNMLYIYVFNLICLYEKNPNTQTLDKVLNIAEFSLSCLQEEEEDTSRCFWMRMFYLRMAYCLLGLSNKGDIISRCIVLPRHIKKAEALLVEVDKIWNGIETRRQMFYYVAQARMAELQNNEEEIDLAIEYINMAVEIGSKGNFGETQFIRNYANLLEDKQSRYNSEETDDKSAAILPVRSATEHDGNMYIRTTTESDKNKGAPIAMEHDEETESLNAITTSKNEHGDPQQTQIKGRQMADFKRQNSVQYVEESISVVGNTALKRQAMTTQDPHISGQNTEKHDHRNDIKEFGGDLVMFKETFESLFISNDSAYGGEHHSSLIHMNRI